MILFFDVSAISKVKNWKAEPTDTDNWPRMLHLAWQMYDDERKLVSFGNKIIKSDNQKITANVAKSTGVTQKQMTEDGVDLNSALLEFNEEVNKAKTIISFNWKYNASILLCEYKREKIKTDLDVKDSFCLMHESTYYCKLPSRYGGFKWPTLTQLYAKIYQAKLEGINQADTDVIACASCFYKLMDLGQLEDLFD